MQISVCPSKEIIHTRTFMTETATKIKTKMILKKEKEKKISNNK